MPKEHATMGLLENSTQLNRFTGFREYFVLKVMFISHYLNNYDYLQRHNYIVLHSRFLTMIFLLGGKWRRAKFSLRRWKLAIS